MENLALINFHVSSEIHDFLDIHFYLCVLFLGKYTCFNCPYRSCYHIKSVLKYIGKTNEEINRICCLSTLSQTRNVNNRGRGRKGPPAKSNKQTTIPKYTAAPDSELSARNRGEDVDKIIDVHEDNNDSSNVLTTDHDYTSLNGSNWFDDKLIDDFIISYLNNSAMHRKILYFPCPILNAFLKTDEKIDLISQFMYNARSFDFRLFIGIVHNCNHWILSVISPALKTIALFDSLNNSDSEYRKIFEGLAKISNLNIMLENDQENLDIDEWNFIISQDSIKQTNGFDCGLFACLFSKTIIDLRSKFPPIKTEDRDVIRKHLKVTDIQLKTNQLDTQRRKKKLTRKTIIKFSTLNANLNTSRIQLKKKSILSSIVDQLLH